MRPEYSFQTSFTVTVVRGSGFRPLLRPGSSCLGLGARMQAVMVLASQDFDSGWFGGFSSQPWESPHRTPTRAFLLPCLRPLVPRGLLLAGRCSACREHAGHCTAGTVAVCPPPRLPRSCCPSRGAEQGAARAPRAPWWPRRGGLRRLAGGRLRSSGATASALLEPAAVIIIDFPVGLCPPILEVTSLQVQGLRCLESALAAGTGR